MYLLIEFLSLLIFLKWCTNNLDKTILLSLSCDMLPNSINAFFLGSINFHSILCSGVNLNIDL